MTNRTNESVKKSGLRFNRVNLMILAVFTLLAVIGGVVAFRFSQNFFVSTSVIKVGNAPPILPGQPTAKPGSTPDPANPGAVTIPQLDPELKDPAKATWNGTSRVTLLVMGLDYRDWSAGVDIPRTDTMILFSMDPLTMSAGMISIPRDMWVNIPGYGSNRINTAYRVGEMYKLPGGGPGLAMKTVEEFLGVPVDYYALIDFNAFVRFIDALGGLDMHIREPIKVDPIGPGNTITLEPGVQALDGATVLAYARQRYTKDGDFDRSKRQQEVIMALRDQVVQFNQLPMLVSKAPQLYQELSSGIRTNLQLDQVIQLAWLATKIDPNNIKKGVFDPHKDVAYATVTTSEGAADVLVPNPDQIRLLRDSVFVQDSAAGPSAGNLEDLAKSENARVLLRNGTVNPQSVQQVSELIRSLGFNLVGEEAASQAASVTTFIDHTGKPYTVKYLMDQMKLSDGRVQVKFDPNASADLEVVLGSDWKGQ